jgi:hypothetical protein
MTNLLAEAINSDDPDRTAPQRADDVVNYCSRRPGRPNREQCAGVIGT